MIIISFSRCIIYHKMFATLNHPIFVTNSSPRFAILHQALQNTRDIIRDNYNAEPFYFHNKLFFRIWLSGHTSPGVTKYSRYHTGQLQQKYRDSSATNYSQKFTFAQEPRVSTLSRSPSLKHLSILPIFTRSNANYVHTFPRGAHHGAENPNAGTLITGLSRRITVQESTARSLGKPIRVVSHAKVTEVLPERGIEKKEKIPRYAIPITRVGPYEKKSRETATR